MWNKGGAKIYNDNVDASQVIKRRTFKKWASFWKVNNSGFLKLLEGSKVYKLVHSTEGVQLFMKVDTRMESALGTINLSQIVAIWMEPIEQG